MSAGAVIIGRLGWGRRTHVSLAHVAVGRVCVPYCVGLDRAA